MRRLGIAGTIGLASFAVGAANAYAQATTTGLAPALTPVSTLAEPASSIPWVAVEVLVFRSITPSAGHQESWPAEVPAPSAEGAIYPAAAGTAPAPVSITHYSPTVATLYSANATINHAPPAATFAYTAVAEQGALIANASLRLQGSGHYDVVKMIGWRQPADSSRTIRFTPPPPSTVGVPNALSAPFALSSTFALSTPSTPSAPSAPYAQTTPYALPSEKPVVPTVQVKGTARLLAAGDSHYVVLHVRLCQPKPPGIVVWAAPAATVATVIATATPSTVIMPVAATLSALPSTSPAPASLPGRQCFALNQRHLVKPGRLTYFDNPIFGALVSVRPIKPPVVATTTH